MKSLWAVALLLAAGWDRFRGPNGSGVLENGPLPERVGPQTSVLWKTPLPPGHSSPVVSGGRVFLTAVEQERLFTYCLDRATGAIVWRRECPRPRREKLDALNNPASPTPVAGGNNLFVFFPDFGLMSYDFSGNERWRTPLGPFHNVYGIGVSPVLADGRVVLIVDQNRDSFAAAFDAADGRERWRTPRPEALSGASTPIVWQPPEGPLQILAPGSLRLDAYSVRDGRPVWWMYGLPSEMKSVPVLEGGRLYVNGFNTPENDPGRQVAIAPFEQALAADDADHDGKLAAKELSDPKAKRYFRFLDLNTDGFLDADEWRIFRMTMAAENGLLAIRPGGEGDRSATAVEWKFQRSIPQLPSVLVYRGIAYLINDSGVLTTLDAASGKLFRQARLRGVPDRYFAAPVASDGKVFIVSHACVVSVLRAGAQQELLSAGDLDDECFATPAIADGRLYVRTKSALYCFGAPASGLGR